MMDTYWLLGKIGNSTEIVEIVHPYQFDETLDQMEYLDEYYGDHK